jgi:N6-L-threonylcarbamoyladenine synthase
MDSRHLYLGIDTSNYKTSLAVIDDEGGIVFERSELLEVKKGSRGLRQSEAFYQHSMRLPGYFKEALNTVEPVAIQAIAYSSRPRRQEGSYMPCFNAGINAAKILSAAMDIPAYSFSHQEGHAAAIMPQEEAGKSLFMHLSGGTTEFLICEPDENGYDMRIVGGTKDISFGQLLDRAGVALGFPFPAGRYLDDIASASLSIDDQGEFAFPRIKLDDGFFNLSGAETKLLNHFNDRGLSSDDGSALARPVADLFRYISAMLARSAEYLSEKYDIEKIYLAGGVASSKTIRDLLTQSCSLDIYFGDPVLSGDNAVGIARLAKRKHNQ